MVSDVKLFLDESKLFESIQSNIISVDKLL